jgi:hypothetical protein
MSLLAADSSHGEGIGETCEEEKRVSNATPPDNLESRRFERKTTYGRHRACKDRLQR